MTGGAVNEIHIYTAANQFEKSITIMDAVWEMFGLCPSSGPLKMDNLKVARENGFPLVMCSKCAEAVSILYKDFLNLLQLSPAAGGGYLNTLLLHFESWATTTTGKQVMRPGFVHEEEISGGHEINNQETFIQYEQEQSDVLQYHQQAPIPEEGIDILGTGSSNLLAVAVSYPEPQDSDYDPFFESSSHSSSQGNGNMTSLLDRQLTVTWFHRNGRTTYTSTKKSKETETGKASKTSTSNSFRRNSTFQCHTEKIPEGSKKK